MSWLAPWALAAAAAAAIGIGLLHLLARDRPARWILPTARFVAAGSARATRRARTPRDLPLLALRVLALLLAGAAFAGPVLEPRGGSVARIVLLDATTGPRARALAVDSVRARLGEGDRLVLFDTVAHVIPAGRERAVLDSLDVAADAPDDAGGRGIHGGSLSAGLVAAMRTATEVAASADSIGLTIVSPLVGIEDRATGAIRAQWPGRVDVVALDTHPVASDSAWPVRVRGPAGDPVVVAARLAGAEVSSSSSDSIGGALIVRGHLTPADSAAARAGGAVIIWSDSVRDVARDVARATSRDTLGGFVVDDAPVLFAAVRQAAPADGRVVARWIDGTPAATELPLGRGCIRDVAVALPATGDLTLRPQFQRALRVLARPCGGERRPASDSLRAALTGAGPLATATAVRRDATRSPATPWLLGAALLLLLLEPLLRRSARAPERSGEPA